MAVVQSTIKRERLRREESRRLRDEIKHNLPVLTRREIRRFRIPYHEALCLELEEDGCYEAATFFRMLIQFQEDMRSEAGPGSLIWLYPQLKDEKDKLNKVYKGLKAAQEAKQQGNINIYKKLCCSNFN